MSIEGAIGVALVDYSSGMTLGIAGGSPELDLGMAAAGNTDVVRAKMRTLEMLKIEDSIEDIRRTTWWPWSYAGGRSTSACCSPRLGRSCGAWTPASVADASAGRP